MKTRFVFVVALVALSAAAFAQASPWQWRFKWLQRYAWPLSSHESRVFSCEIPRPFNRVAMDDWICTKSGPIVRIGWWGVLLTPDQYSKRWSYYIAIYRNKPGTCQPEEEPIYRACVRPDVIRYTGKWDCRQQRVFYFSAQLPQPFMQRIEQHYWLQISESDKESARVDAEDFRWSAHRPENLCPAGQYSPAAGFIQPILDACDDQPNDLAFVLYSRGIAGTVSTAGYQGKRYATLELRTQDGQIADVVPIELDEDGNFEADPDVEDGVYDLVLFFGSALPAVQRNVGMADGSVRILSFFDIFYGDLDGDNEVSLLDFGILVRNFGMMGE